MPKLRNERKPKSRLRRPTTDGSTTVAPFGVEGGRAATTVTVTTGEMETVVDADEADEMRGGAAWERAVSCGLVDAHVGRPTQEGNGVAATVFRDKEYGVFKYRDAVWMWPIIVVVGGFMRP